MGKKVYKFTKNKSYFKKYQVQKRRRRSGKTDFQARRKMIKQNKNKYNNRKYRLIVRISNQRIMCQVAYATMTGDKIVAAASSSDLKAFGIPVGLKNYAAAYATGLLIARRCLKKFGQDQMIKGKEELDGEDYHVEEEDTEQRPFKCILDLGIRRTCVGSRVWGALKGAADGGLHVPHEAKNFPGYTPAEDKGGESQYDAETHKEKIMGTHVKEYMEMMQEDDSTKYEAHFSKYIENDIDAEKVEEMYEEAHAKIRENPDGEPTEKQNITWKRDGNKVTSSDGTDVTRTIKLSLKQRKEKVAAKMEAARQRVLAACADEE